ncbi:Gpi16 subunit GPI transamidase component [Gautieria morchelliformis]|nr:Gpi16 subunit GPI transamidase component [Gautieria morchelliformis]
MAEHFNEGLHIRPLQDGRVYTHFSFKTLLTGAVPRSPATLHVDDESQHYNVFPLALGQIIREYAVTELHLSLNAGKWDYSSWGHPDDPGVASGAELWAWMGDNSDGRFNARWQGLRNALAGLFCASLGELDERRTTSPVYAFQPDGDLPAGMPHRLTYASHPSENICTENLTPFLKLLPCKSRSGIASLLNPHRLFDADWHGISIRVLWNSDEGVEVQLGVQAVFNPVRLKTQKNRDWSFSDIFERTIDTPCPVAQTSIVTLDLPINTTHTISPESARLENGTAIYDIRHVDFCVSCVLVLLNRHQFTERRVTASEPVSLAPLSIVRSHTGTSQAKGRLHVSLTNTLEEAQRVAYLETPPWIVKFYLHTLTISVNEDLQPRDDVLQELIYFPTTANYPTLFEPTLLLPPRSTVHLTLAFDKTFLRYTEHPPDAQRGWDLPPAVLVPLPWNSSNGSSLPRMYTNALLVDLATPDFSMPYNVIIMSSTLVALLFGSIFNLLTRNFVAVKVD